MKWTEQYLPKTQRQYTKLYEFERHYRKYSRKKTILDTGREWVRRNCSKQCLKKSVLNNFPFIKIMRDYAPLRDLPSDIIAGFTVGIMQIPQGMAYATLATLPPICGLYTSLFAPLIYFFLGSSKHASMGTIAVVSLMFASVLDSTLDETLLTETHKNSTQTGFSELDLKKIELVTALTLVSGLIMMVLGKLGMGIVTTYMSEYLISGFTSGVAIHVLTSQAKILLGLHIDRFNGIFKVAKTWIAIFKHITSVNWAPVVVSLISMVVIYIVKVCVNIRFQARLRIPIPIELIVVILGTVASYYGHFHDNYNMLIVGEIPAGIPNPKIPDVGLVTSSLMINAFIIGVLAFAQSVSMAKTLALKNDYSVNANQEMFAYGAGSVLSSIFSGYITAASVARSAIQDGAGGKTQVAALSSCCIVLVVVLAVGPLFYALPQCVLASVIIVNLRGMFRQFLQLKPLWQNAKYDFSIWVVTFLCTVVLDADIGLLIGIVYSVFSVVIRTQRSSFVKVGSVSNSCQYRSVKLYDNVQTQAGTVMLTFNSPIYFANAEMFKDRCYKVSGINPRKLKRNKKKMELVVTSGSAADGSKDQDANCNGSIVITNDSDTNHVIIIMDNMPFVDTMGIKVIKQVVADLNSVGIRVSLVGFSESVLDILKSYGLLESMQDIIFLSVSGALYTSHDTEV
ncbi:sulfate transporter-like [Gigantopelta aegis]|uniref:sulfate transporter-like n=1 Tax=Gigantopelta aegis TaxID=1735272 RepID=UPI001B888E4A|nr:sulfate transporter-like [Gigantopelta aegis]